jgi:hypothetical protein
MGRSCSTNEVEEGNVEKPEANSSQRRPRRRWILKREDDMNWSGSCEHGIEPSGSIQKFGHS